MAQRRGIAVYLEQRIVAAIGIRLQNTGEGRQVALGMLLPPVPRGIVEGGGWRLSTKGFVIPDIGLDAARIGFCFRQDRHGRVITMQSLGGQDMRLDQRVDGLEGHGTSTDLVGQRRQAEIDPLSGVALALPIERLMLAELLEQDHRQQVGSGKASWRHMEGCWRLGNLLAFAAGELLPNGLNDLSLTRDGLQVVEFQHELTRFSIPRWPTRSG